MTACWSLRMSAAKERRSGWPVVSFHGGQPAVEVAAAGSRCHHLGEGGHVPGERADVRGSAA